MVRPDPPYLHLESAFAQPANFIPETQVWNRFPEYALDLYLARGWFRSQHTMFVSYFMNAGEKIHDIVPLRIDLRNYRVPAKIEKMFRRLGEFEFWVSPFYPNAEFFELLRRYKHYEEFGYQWDHFESFKITPPLFRTYEIKMKHNDRVAAIGLIDLGQRSAMGLLNIYDPEYGRYSPGKLLVAAKINWLQSMHYRYFYPGYFVPGYAKFDYKLQFAPQATEYIDFLDGHWKPIRQFGDHGPNRDILNQLQQVQNSSKHPLHLRRNNQACFIHPLSHIFNLFEMPWYLSEHDLIGTENETVISYHPSKKMLEEIDIEWMDQPMYEMLDPAATTGKLMVATRRRPFPGLV